MVGIICQANYCRSPVAEKLLKNYLPDTDVKSYGINYFPRATMDERSQKFLTLKGIDDIYHVPKKITSNDIKNLKIILVMDTKVLDYLIHQHKESMSKIKHFTFLDPKMFIHDPYKLKDESEYFEVMENIDLLCKKWANELRNI